MWFCLGCVIIAAGGLGRRGRRGILRWHRQDIVIARTAAIFREIVNYGTNKREWSLYLAMRANALWVGEFLLGGSGGGGAGLFDPCRCFGDSVGEVNGLSYTNFNFVSEQFRECWYIGKCYPLVCVFRSWRERECLQTASTKAPAFQILQLSPKKPLELTAQFNNLEFFL